MAIRSTGCYGFRAYGGHVPSHSNSHLFPLLGVTEMLLKMLFQAQSETPGSNLLNPLHKHIRAGIAVLLGCHAVKSNNNKEHRKKQPFQYSLHLHAFCHFCSLWMRQEWLVCEFDCKLMCSHYVKRQWDGQHQRSPSRSSCYSLQTMHSEKERNIPHIHFFFFLTYIFNP